VSTKTRTITNEKTKTKNLGQTIQQYCANLPWHSNANITWFLVLGLKNSGIFGGSADMAPTNATSFWKQKSTDYSLLAPVAEDFVFAPASQAYVELIFFCVMHSV